MFLLFLFLSFLGCCLSLEGCGGCYEFSGVFIVFYVFGFVVVFLVGCSIVMVEC